MARNYKELQAKMDPASRADNKQRVREELQRMALEELRGAKQLTQADMAEMLDVPQSSISRIEQRADMYLSTLRNYIHAVGGELRIQAVFPDGGTVVIDRFGEYEERPYVVDNGGGRRCIPTARAPPTPPGSRLLNKTFQSFRTYKSHESLHLPDAQIACIKASLEKSAQIESGSGPSIQRIFRFRKMAENKLEPMAGLPQCVTMAVESGDPSKGASVIVFKGTAGCLIPWHWHTPTEHVMIVTGSAKVEMKDTGKTAVSVREGTP